MIKINVKLLYNAIISMGGFYMSKAKYGYGGWVLKFIFSYFSIKS